jgi:pSer/pThr/pTyr-binding forkhead associated (FHA) protein
MPLLGFANPFDAQSGQDPIAMDYQLVVVRGRSASRTLKIPNGITTVGRQDDCQLRIGSSQVSRKHCQLYERDQRLVVMDLGSSNGTFVNGKRIESQTALAHGDVLSLGKVKLRVEKIGEPPLSRPAARPPSDTAVAEGVLGLDDDGGDDEEFDIDFDDEPEAEPEPAPESEPAESGSAPAPPPAARAGSKGEPKAKTAEPEPAPHADLADEAVADFLLGIELDEDDKR